MGETQNEYCVHFCYHFPIRDWYIRQGEMTELNLENWIPTSIIMLTARAINMMRESALPRPLWDYYSVTKSNERRKSNGNSHTTESAVRKFLYHTELYFQRTPESKGPCCLQLSDVLCRPNHLWLLSCKKNYRRSLLNDYANGRRSN